MSDKIPNMDFDADEVIEDFKSKFKWPSSNEVEVVVRPPVVYHYGSYRCRRLLYDASCNEFQINRFLYILVCNYCGVLRSLLRALRCKDKNRTQRVLQKAFRIPDSSCGNDAFGYGCRLHFGLHIA